MTQLDPLALLDGGNEDFDAVEAVNVAATAAAGLLGRVDGRDLADDDVRVAAAAGEQLVAARPAAIAPFRAIVIPPLRVMVVAGGARPENSDRRPRSS
jgi:hypothetical protein